MKKQKHFYSHLVSIESVHVEISYLEMTDDQKKELLDIAESTMHHTILDTVLSALSEEERRVFLRQVHLDDHAQIWRFLNKKKVDIESRIVSVGEALLKRLHEDIQEAKTK